MPVTQATVTPTVPVTQATDTPTAPVTTTPSATDTQCPQITIQSPADGGTVNAGNTVQVVAQAADNGPNDTGVSGFHYSASGDALTANVSQDLPLPQPQAAPTLRFTFTVKEAADLVTVTDKTITITVSASDAATPPNTCSQTITVTAIGTLDQCDGAISAEPSSGYDDDPVTITVAISGDAASLVTRVTTMNPGGEFPLQSQGNGVFQTTLYYHGQGSFTLSFTAYDASGTALCSGSIGLTALGPPPGSARTRAIPRQLPAGATGGATLRP